MFRAVPWTVFLLLLSLASPAGGLRVAEAQGFWVVPLDVTQGAALGRGSPVPFTGSARLHLGRAFGEGGRVRAGPSGALLFENPGLEVAGGGRASLRLVGIGLPMLSGWGLYLQAEQLYGTGDVAPGSVGLLADLGVVRLGVLGSHDWRTEVRTVQGTIGVGLHALIPLLRPLPPREPDFGPQRRMEPGGS